MERLRKLGNYKRVIFILFIFLLSLRLFDLFYFSRPILISEKTILTLMFFGIAILWIGEMETRRRMQTFYQDLKNSDEMKTRLISNVSHELRTPLTTIKEYNSILLDQLAGAVSPEQKEYLSIISNNINRLYRLISNMLDVSRIESGKVKIKRQLVNVVELIQGDLSAFKREAARKGIEVDAYLPAALPSTYLDPSQINQVITNLVENALKFTEKGGRILLAAKDHPAHIEVSVADTGRGIAEEDQKRIFERFQQIDRTPGSGERGVGLGLSIVRDIIEMHRGKIWVESQLGKGSKFSFILPKYNRETYCQERIAERMRLAKEEQISLALIMIGIDNADEIRESLGEEGYLGTVDELEVIIHREVRDQLDEVFKYKYRQEEVNILVLAGTEIEGAFSMLRRIKKSVAEYRFRIPPLVSFGVAAYPGDAPEAEALIHKAGQRRSASSIKA